ncbi:MAG: PAS domain S-box protein [Desulfobacteraceae bacterium]|nr:PAS domain S-box protein [Desulfobacteraceae bacterium]
MDISLKNRRIFTKMLLGFMLILILAALMGGVLFYNLRDVTGVLRLITERNAPSIRYPTGVERYALRTILNEKNYLLLGKKEIHAQAMRDIREIYANLDRVDQVAAKYNDQGLLQKSGDVRRAVEEYRGYYNRGVALLEENEILEHKMRMLGRKLNNLSRTHTLAHKRLMEEAVANGIDQTKHMQGYRLTNEIEREVFEIRRQEKNYILYKKREHFDGFKENNTNLGSDDRQTWQIGLKEHIANLDKLYDEIHRVDSVREHQPLIAETRETTDEYLSAIEKWVANNNELQGILVRMHKIGVKVQETARDAQEAGWQAMDTSKENAVKTTEKASLTGILVAGVTIIMGIVLAFFIARSIAAPIRGLAQTTAGIARGDLSMRVAVKGRDETGQLANSFNKMVEALQKTMVSRDYFDNIIKSMMDTLIVVDAEAKIETVNPATCDLLGYTEEELIGQPIGIIFAEEEVYRFFQFFRGSEKAQALGPQDTVRNRELTYRAKDGRFIPMSFNASVITDEGGNVTGVVAGAKDITDLKLAEAEIKRERNFSENIIATVPDSLLVVDKDLKIKKANRTFYETFQTGIEPEKVIGTRITEILQDKEGKLSTELKKLFGTEDMLENFELHYQPACPVGTVDRQGTGRPEKPGERIFNITARGILVAEEEEEEEELIMLRDRTEQKRAEEALNRERERFRILIEESPLGVSIIGTGGDYQYVNPRFVAMFGYTLDEIPTGRKWFRKAYPDNEYRKQAISAWLTAIKETKVGPCATLIFTVTCKDGAKKVIQFLIVTMETGDQFIIYEDITAQRKLEAQLIQSQKLEAVGRLAGGVAHDFNNLLTTIIGNAGLLLMRLDKEDPQREDLEEIRDAGDRAALLTRQLLAFSRKQPLRLVVLNLNEVITDMNKMLERLIGEDVKVGTVLESGLMQVKADPGQMEQIIMNLAVNAKDAMPRGGKLTIETANMYLDEAYCREHGVELKPGPYVMLGISDTGIGMDEETESHIFEPFFTTKEKGVGTGLGLSTVYGIVKQLEGCIWVYSEPGQGTTFKIYLPGVETAAEPVKRDPTLLKGLEGSETVLLVEDDRSVLNLARKVLQQQGYRVLEAQNGEDALKVSKEYEGSIHLLITDVVMTGMNGRELAERIIPLYPEVKVLFMSGYTDNVLSHYGVLESGINFLEKPFSPEILMRKVRTVLDS